MVKKINNKLKIDYQKGIIENRLLQIIPKDPNINILNLISVWVIDITAKDSSKILTNLKTINDDPINLQHLKRVRKEPSMKETLTVLICSTSYINTESQILDKLTNLNIDNFSNPRQVQVPDHSPNIKELSNEWTMSYWPLIWKGNVNDQILNDSIINMDWIHSHLQTISQKSLQMEQESISFPIVTLIAKGSEIISLKTDKRSSTDPLTHSIFSCIDEITSSASSSQHQYLLQNYDVYTTHEPCTMCCMALIHSRVNRLIYLKQSPATGALRSRYFVHDHKLLNSNYEVWEWIGEEYQVGLVHETVSC